MRDLERLEEYDRQAGSARAQGLAALDRARSVRQAILAERGGEYLADSADLIREMREERDDEVGTGLR